MTRTTRPLFLNPHVEATVMESVSLLAMWVVTRQPYDDEIEPLHNPDWVRSAKLKEEAHLAKLQGALQEAQAIRVEVMRKDMETI